MESKVDMMADLSGEGIDWGASEEEMEEEEGDVEILVFMNEVALVWEGVWLGLVNEGWFVVIVESRIGWFSSATDGGMPVFFKGIWATRLVKLEVKDKFFEFDWDEADEIDSWTWKAPDKRQK